MTREELKEIVIDVVQKMSEQSEAPVAGCIFSDKPDPCDATTFYAIGEEG